MTLNQRLRLVQAAAGLVSLLYFSERDGERNGTLTRLSPRLAALGRRIGDAVWLAEVGNDREREQALQDAAQALEEVYHLARLADARGLLSCILYRVRGEREPINPRAGRR